MTEPGRLLVGTLTASLAHDLRNVLAVIRTAVVLAGQPERTPRELEKIARNADRGLALIELVLAMVRGEPLERAPFAPLAPFREAAEEYRGLLTFVLPVPEALPEVMGVAPLLTSAFVVLFDNAYAAGARNIRLHSTITDASLTWTVEDDGPGIADGLAARIFEADASARGGGTGLGLWFARYALEQMGGTLALARGSGDAEDSGARFRITIPRSN